MSVQFQNFYEATLSAPCSATDLSISLTPIPSITEGWLLIDYDNPAKREFVYFTSKGVSSVSGPDLATFRGRDDTSAVAHDQNAKVRMNVNKGILEGLRDGSALGDGFITNAMLGDDTITPDKLVPSISVTGATSPLTPDSTTGLYIATALGASMTISAPSGTPRDGQGLVLRLKDNGTARSLSWNSIYRAIGITLPTATVASKTYYIGMRYNAADVKWDCLSVSRQV